MEHVLKYQVGSKDNKTKQKNMSSLSQRLIFTLDDFLSKSFLQIGTFYHLKWGLQTEILRLIICQ